MRTSSQPHDVELIGRLAPGLVLFARQWCQCGEDVVQEAFVKLFRQPHPPDHIPAWLYRVVRNGAINAARSQARRDQHEQMASQSTQVWFEATQEQTLDIEIATRALRSQPIELRETIVARLWGCLSFDEIAVLMDTSPSTASRRYQSGLEALRQQLGVKREEESHE